ncbi:MAG: 2-C-methyl-D-erythritol 4-phosphate cytidylyltransferase [Actinomycetota bacterium]|nr:2-C-methyl-D-erythritol 4-phosphate cytidylyltransferase [Actinomycetota bacterium]
MIWAIVVAAGSGTRYGGLKQFERLGGRSLVEWAVEHPRTVADGVVLVVPPEHLDADWPEVDAVVAGGRTRSDSVRAGLAAIPAGVDVVLVHDAARPGARRETFEQVVAALAAAEAVVPGLPIPDTLRHLDGTALDRDRIVAVQTPQGFRADSLRAAHAGGGEATDDATLVERAGGRVVVVPGTPEAMKVTTKDDLRVLAALLP